jgi:hypothetical protein
MSEVFLQMTPEVEQLLIENDVSVPDLLRKAGVDVAIAHRTDPASLGNGKKEPAIVLMATAAVVVAASPLIRQIVHNLSGRNVVITERRLIPVEDSSGNIVRDIVGNPILHWVDVVKGVAPQEPNRKSTIAGLGIKISMG